MKSSRPEMSSELSKVLVSDTCISTGIVINICDKCETYKARQNGIGYKLAATCDPPKCRQTWNTEVKPRTRKTTLDSKTRILLELKGMGYDTSPFEVGLNVTFISAKRTRTDVRSSATTNKNNMEKQKKHKIDYNTVTHGSKKKGAMTNDRSSKECPILSLEGSNIPSNMHEPVSGGSYFNPIQMNTNTLRYQNQNLVSKTQYTSNNNITSPGNTIVKTGLVDANSAIRSSQKKSTHDKVVAMTYHRNKPSNEQQKKLSVRDDNKHTSPVEQVCSKRTSKVVSANGKKVIVPGIPTSHTVIPIHLYSKLRNGYTEMQSFRRNVNKAKKGLKSEEGDAYLGKAVSQLPGTSLLSLQTGTPLIVAGFLKDAGVTGINYQNIPNATRGRNSISEALTKQTTKDYHKGVLRLKINPYIYITLDKATMGKGKGPERKGAVTASLPKKIVWFDPISGVIEEFLLDVDSAGGTSANTALAIKHSMEKIYGTTKGIIVTMLGQGTDSGGGGTLKSLARELRKLGIQMSVNYRVGSCSLHDLQTSLRNAIESVFGSGGKNSGQSEYKKNAMQLIHGLWNITNYIPYAVLKNAWDFACKKLNITASYVQMPQPILTRWWTVGACASYTEKYWEVWQIIMKGLVNCPKAKVDVDGVKDSVHTIAKANQKLLNIDEIKSDIMFLSNIHEYWLFPHFKFLQGGDEVTKNKPGYMGRLMSLRYYLICHDLEIVQDNKWLEHEAFKKFTNHYTEMLSDAEKIIQTRKVEHFLSIALKSIHKHFSKWTNEHMLYSVFSDKEIGSEVAKIFLGMSSTSNGANGMTYTSKSQDGRKINVGNFISFFKKRCTINMGPVLQAEVDFAFNHGKLNLPNSVKLIASGLDIWDESSSCNNCRSTPICNYYRKFMSTFMTNTQGTERAVKLSNFCSQVTRSEGMRSVYATSNFLTNRDAASCFSNNYKPSARKKNPIDMNDVFKTKVKAKSIFAGMRDNDNAVNNLQDDIVKEEQEHIKSLLTSKNKQFYVSMETQIFQCFVEHFDNPARVNTESEKQASVDRTPLANGKVTYKSVKRNKMEKQLILEISKRGVNLINSKAMKWEEIKDVLKDLEGNKESFVPMTDIENFVDYDE